MVDVQAVNGRHGPVPWVYDFKWEKGLVDQLLGTSATEVRSYMLAELATKLRYYAIENIHNCWARVVLNLPARISRMQLETKRRAARTGIRIMIALSIAAIAWRLADLSSKFAEAACFGMWGYLCLYLAAVPKELWLSESDDDPP